MSAPLVSVLVTTYNHARYVEEALDSLRMQTSRAFEVIITDDASPDGTAGVIEAWLTRTQFPARLIRNPVNRGICANRNRALALSSGHYVCSLSGDDAYQPERVARQLSHFRAQPEQVAAVYSDALVVDAEGRASGKSFLQATCANAPPPSGRLFPRIAAGNFICAPAVMVRRSAIDAVGGYDESLSYEDFDMWLRLSHRFDFVYLPGELVRYRRLPSSMSHSEAGRAAMRASQISIFRKWIGAGFDPDTERVVVDGLWEYGKYQLLWRQYTAAREAFALAAAHAQLPRRIVERVLRMPFSCDAVRSLGLLARRLRGLGALEASTKP